MQIDFHLLKQTLSLNLILEVDFRLYGYQLEKLDITSWLRRRSSD